MCLLKGKSGWGWGRGRESGVGAREKGVVFISRDPAIATSRYSQCTVHLAEGILGLVKEVEYYRRAELVIRRVVHLQYLHKCVHIEGIPTDSLERGELIVLDCVSRANGNTSS